MDELRDQLAALEQAVAARAAHPLDAHTWGWLVLEPGAAGGLTSRLEEAWTEPDGGMHWSQLVMLDADVAGRN